MSLKDLVESSIAVILEASTRCGGYDNLAVSFNGGKDCTVLLDLFMAAAKKAGHSAPLKVCYVRTPHPFSEIEDFIEAVCKSDRLKLYEYEAMPLKEGFTKFIEDTDVKGVLVGIRRTDPYGKNLVPLIETDNGWPRFLRVNPLLDWTYQDIWAYIRENDLPYCRLYDQGYTSLGDADNSKPNISLKRPDETFRPAHELEHDEDERLSRS